MSQDERIEITDLRRCGLSLRTIADRLGRATARRARPHRRRVDTNDRLSGLVTELLGRRWSTQQISRHLRQRFSEDPSMWLCHESINQAVYQPNSRFIRPPQLAPHRRSLSLTAADRSGSPPRTSVHAAPAAAVSATNAHHPRSVLPPDRRSQAGHWEGDLIIGSNHLSAIGTLVERQTRMLRLVHLARADSDSVHAALVAACRTCRRR